MPKLRFPHPLTLLVGCVIVAAALTWILPAGHYERREDPKTGRNIVIAGTYSRIEAQPVGPFQAVVAIPKGIVDAASVIALVFLIGGAFTVIERTGTLGRLAETLADRLRGRGLVVIPVASVGCASLLVFGREEVEERIMVTATTAETRRTATDATTA